jgi:predicted ATPase
MTAMGELPSGTVTFLFTDLEGSTRLLEEHGERYADLLAEHRRVLREACQRHGGIEVDTQGDAFFVAFARASGALAAAEAAQQALKFPVRMGIHTGEPQLAHQGYVGMDVHRAARICAAGHGGQVLLSQATRDLIESDVQELGVHRLKDVGELRLYQLGERRFPPLRSLNQTNLPLRDEALVGRKKELADLLRLIRADGARLVTLIGPGGIGKTSFAVELAAELVEDFADGVWFVDLSALRDPELIAPTISSILGAKVELAAHIGVRELLLVLDNFEQVVEGAPQLSVLLDRCPNLRGLVTSREPLHLGRERTYPLRPLAESPAVELFRRRAAALDPDFEAAYEQLAELCARLDNLPLALELAAARTQALSVPQLRERLEERLPLLSARRRDVPERQRTLRATIEWSYELLDPHEQELFRAVSVFAGGFTLDAAEQVCDAHLDTLESLVEKGLVRRDANRFRMLETVREFAEQLAPGDRDTFVLKHTAYYLVMAESAAVTVSDRSASSGDREYLDRLEVELENYRNALSASVAAGDSESAIRLCGALRHLWLRRGPVREGRRWIEQAMANADDVDDSLRATALFARGSVAWALDDADTAEQAFRELLEIAVKLEDAGLTATTQVGLAAAARARGDLDRAAELLEEALAYRRTQDDRNALRRALHHLGEVERDRGQFERARELLGEAVEVARELGADASRAGAVHGLGDLALDEGRLDEAAGHYAEALALASEIGLPPMMAAALPGLAAVAAARDDVDRAALFWAASERVAEDNDFTMPAFERVRYERLVSRLPPEEFAVALEWARTRDLASALRVAATSAGTGEVELELHW